MEGKIAGYYRVSQARDDMRAPELYEDDIRRYCAYRKVPLAEMFSDIDFSGYRGSKPRPALEKLKERRSEFSMIVIPKLSRFGRSMKDLVNLFDMFDRDGIALMFLDMNIDTSTSQGRLLRHIMAAFAEYESDVKSDYSKATQRMLVREGRPQGWVAPYGYVLRGKGAERMYYPDEPAASIVRELFERCVAGDSMMGLARAMTEREVATPKGGEWSHQRVKWILDNTSYAGFRVKDGKEFPAAWEPLVSRELFDQVKQARHERRSSYKNPSGGRSHLLSGLLVCGVCGKNLYFGYGTDRRTSYRCPRKAKPPKCLGGAIEAGRVEELVQDAVFRVLDLAEDDATKARATTIRGSWAEADIARRRGFLGEVVARVVLVPRPGNRHGKGVPMGRPIQIFWAEPWSTMAFGFPGASFQLHKPGEPFDSSKGLTWAEWRRLRLSRP